MVIDGLDLHSLKQQATDYLASNDRHIATWRSQEKAKGSIPQGDYAESLLFKASRIAEEIQTKLSEFGELQERSAIETFTNEEGLVFPLELSIPNVSKAGEIVHYTVSSDTPNNIMRLWLYTRIASHFGLADTGVLLFVKNEEVKEIRINVPADQANFDNILGFYQFAMSHPVAYTPDIGYKALEMNAKGKSVDEIKQAVKTEWDGPYRFGKPQPGLKENPAVNRCFNDFETFYESFWSNINPIMQNVYNLFST